MKKTPKQQDQFKVSERNGQLVFALNSEKMIPENAPVRPASAMLEELDYEKLYGAYSPLGKKSAADPRVLFKVLVFGYMCGIYSSRKLEEAGGGGASYGIHRWNQAGKPGWALYLPIGQLSSSSCFARMA